MSKQILVSLKRGHPERAMRARLNDGAVHIINETGIMLPEDQISDEMRDCRWFLVGGELPETSQPELVTETPQEPIVPPADNPPLEDLTDADDDAVTQAKAQAKAEAQAKAAAKAEAKAAEKAAAKATAKPKAPAKAKK